MHLTNDEKAQAVNFACRPCIQMCIHAEGAATFLPVGLRILYWRKTAISTAEFALWSQSVMKSWEGSRVARLSGAYRRG